jgi:glyoxalase superfamily protein
VIGVKGIRLKDIVIDARHPAGLARFWATVLGYQVRAYEQDDIAFLTSIGRTPESDPAVAIDPPDGIEAPSVFFNEVPEPKTTKNRVHLDVWLPGPDVAPLVGLGATVLRAPDEEIDWWVVADPEGNEFCAFPAR